MIFQPPKNRKKKQYILFSLRSPIYHIFIHFIVQNLVIWAKLAQKYHTINGHSSQLQYYYTSQTLGEIMWMTRIKIIFPNVLWSYMCPHDQVSANEMSMEVVQSNSGNFPKQRITFLFPLLLLAGWNDDWKAGAESPFYGFYGHLTKDTRVTDQQETNGLVPKNVLVLEPPCSEFSMREKFLYCLQHYLRFLSLAAKSNSN